MGIFYLTVATILVIVFLLFGIGVFYFFIVPPKVVSVSPLDQSLNVSLNSPLVIKFNKPVARQKVNHATIPEVYGEWKFEDPLIGGHLFRTLVFIPSVNLRPNTKYYFKIDNITTPISIGTNSWLLFSFETKSQDIKVAGAEYANDTILKLIETPFHWQSYPLSCEAASLKMALAVKGVNVSENDIMQKIGYDTTTHKGNTWGNPYNAFVGSLNGSMCTTGYGVYWKPVAKAASNWRPAEYFSGWDVKQLVDEIMLGNPVIVWGVLPTGKLTDCSWYTPGGEYIKAYKEDHVRLAVGFVGDPENPTKIITKDPLSGDIYWTTSDFLTNWKKYDNSGVVIK